MMGLVGVMTIAFAASGGGCTPNRTHDEVKEVKEPIGYARGPWWRADVNQTLLGVAHILITHRDSVHTVSLLGIPGEHAARSRDEARAIALDVRAVLRKSPEKFAELAEQYSEDRATAPLGGVIGTIMAPHLPVQLVDALGNLAFGEVSRVIETDLGFHIVRRLPVAAPQVVDASTIVIGYEGSETLVRPDRPIHRTRAEALELARSIRAKLRDQPAAFADLARTYSDSFEAGSGGDYGQWSTHTRAGEPTLLYVLSQLKPTEISDVLDTPTGFRIMRRDPHKDRGSYTLTQLLVAYDHPDTMPRIRSVEAANRIVAEVSKQLRQNPASFDALRAEHCDHDYCKQEPRTIPGGASGLVPLLQRVAALRVGEVTVEPTPCALGWVFARREDPSGHPEQTAEAFNFDLPRPPSLSVANATKQELAWYVGELRARALQEMKLDDPHQKRLEEIFDALKASYAAVDTNARAQVTADAGNEVVAALGREDASKLAQINEALIRELSGELDSH